MKKNYQKQGNQLGFNEYSIASAVAQMESLSERAIKTPSKLELPPLILPSELIDWPDKE